MTDSEGNVIVPTAVVTRLTWAIAFGLMLADTVLGLVTGRHVLGVLGMWGIFALGLASVWTVCSQLRASERKMGRQLERMQRPSADSEEGSWQVRMRALR